MVSSRVITIMNTFSRDIQMSVSFKDYFSNVSQSYRQYRPAYPRELFKWLAGISPRHDAALDCGCGTGQASIGLAAYFQKVYAVDPSKAQITNAVRNEKVAYNVAPAEATGLYGNSIDLIVAAQSLHWFDIGRFYGEVRRVAAQGAVFAAVSYGLVTVDEKIDELLQHLYYDILGPYWPPERKKVDDGYRTLSFPFREIAVPAFGMKAQWDREHFLGYLSTWSAAEEMRSKNGIDILEMMDAELRQAWGAPAETKLVTWPLHLRVGIVE
jgi:ubiquinone/menaquinone biosynthesis C-methylase UbiE